MSRLGAGIVSPTGGNDTFTKILLHMDGANGSTTFTDDNAGGSAHTWSVHGSTSISTSSFKFGPSSQRVNAGSYISSSSTDFVVGAQDFTIDFWFNLNGDNLAYNRYLAGKYATGSGFFYLLFAQSTNGGQLTFTAYNGATRTIQSTTNFTNSSSWVHAEILRSSTDLLLFINGSLQSTVAIGSGAFDYNGSAFGIGTAPGADAGFPDYDFRGYLDEFRYSVGIARHTANFTPPTGPYF